MLPQDNSVNKLIHENVISQGYMMINIEGKSGEEKENMLAFTVGMYANYGKPDMLIMGENPESIIDMLKGLIGNYQLGLTTEESVHIAEIDGETLKMADVPDEVKEMLAPQINAYYQEYHPKLVDAPVVWVGKNSRAYPFDYFLLPESERPKNMPIFTDASVN